jgi:hypothetical protein
MESVWVKVDDLHLPAPPARRLQRGSRRPTQLELLHRLGGDSPLWPAQQAGCDVDCDQLASANPGVDLAGADQPATAKVSDPVAARRR